MLLTASLDSAIKVYLTKFKLSNQECSFDRTSKPISKVNFLKNSTRVITQNDDDK